MPIACPQCGMRYTIADEHAGRQVRCTNCQLLFVAAATSDDFGASSPIPLSPSSPPPVPPLPSSPPPLPPPGYGWPGGFAHPVVVRRGLAWWTIALLIAALLIEYALEFSPLVAELDRLGDNVDDETADLSTALTLLCVGGTMLLCLLIPIVTYLCWVYYSYRNLYGLGAESMRFSPGSAVAWHFCPIANLWKIPQALNDLWIGSDPRARRWASPVIPLWICLVVLYRVLSRLANHETMEEQIPPVLTVLLSTAETICQGYIILKITSFQAKKQRQRTAAPTDAGTYY